MISVRPPVSSVTRTPSGSSSIDVTSVPNSTARPRLLKCSRRIASVRHCAWLHCPPSVGANPIGSYQQRGLGPALLLHGDARPAGSGAPAPRERLPHRRASRNTPVVETCGHGLDDKPLAALSARH